MPGLNQYSSLLNYIPPDLPYLCTSDFKISIRRLWPLPQTTLPVHLFCNHSSHCVSYFGPLFRLKALNSPHLQVLMLAVPSTWNALSYKTVSSLVPERISLTTLRSPLCLLESLLAIPTSLLSICHLLTSFILPHSIGTSPTAKPLLSHTPLYSQSLAWEPVDGMFSRTMCWINQPNTERLNLPCLQSNYVKQSIKISLFERTALTTLPSIQDVIVPKINRLASQQSQWLRLSILNKQLIAVGLLSRSASSLPTWGSSQQCSKLPPSNFSGRNRTRFL